MAYAPALGASVGDRIDQLIQKGFLSQVGTSAIAPTGVPILTIDELESRFASPWYKKWWVLALAGTAVVGGGILVFRPRRKSS